MTAMMELRSASLSLKPKSWRPIRNSSPETLPRESLAAMYWEMETAELLHWHCVTVSCIVISKDHIEIPHHHRSRQSS